MKRLFLSKSTYKYIISFVVLTIFIIAFDLIDKPISGSKSIFDYKLYFFFFITSIWMVNTDRRITHRRISNFITLTGSSILFWIIVQYLKYRFTYTSPVLETFGWYLYYIPITLIPLWMFYASLFFNKNDNLKLDKRWYLLLIPALIMIILVLTNNYHQLVFKFNTNVFSDDDYKHNFVYYIIVAWNVILISITLINALRQSINPMYKSYGLIPFLPLIIGGVLMVLDFFFDDIISLFLSFSEIYWLMIILFFEGLCLIKLIPTNVGYEEYFDKSSINTSIYTSKYKEVFNSNKELIIPKEALINSIGKPVLLDENTKLNSIIIKGGYVFYTEDITSLNIAHKNMEEYKNLLFEYNELLESENELLKKQSNIKVKESLYDSIFTSIKKEYDYIKNIIDSLDENSNDLISKLKSLNIVDSYIKRMSNLLLLKESNEYLSSKDLDYSINETFEYLALNNIIAKYNSSLNDIKLDSNIIVVIYYSIWKVIFNSIESIESIAVSLFIKEDSIILRILIEGENKPLEERITYKDAILENENLEYENIYSLTIKGGVLND